jgi:putative NADH-flavin reductase
MEHHDSHRPGQAKRVAVVGATGGTGAELVRQALEGGHAVVALARDPGRVATTHARLTVVQADVLDRASLAGAFEGVDAVLGAVGASGGRAPTTVYSTGTANILHEMRASAVTRFLGVTAFPVTPRNAVGPLERYVLFPMLYRFFGGTYRDMARMEATLRATDVDWTVFRPSRLTHGDKRGRYRLSYDEPLTRATKISRADLAAALLESIDDPRSVRRFITVAY